MSDPADLIRAALDAKYDAGKAVARATHDLAHREPDDLAAKASAALQRSMDTEIDMWAGLYAAPPEICDAVLAGIHETPQETP